MERHLHIIDGGAAASTRAHRALGREAVGMLAEIPLFASLSRRHLGRIASVASTRRYAPRATLALRGKPADAFFVILDGSVRVELPGRTVELGAGDFFGEMALIDGEPRSATVIAVGDVYVMTIPRAKFLKLLHAEPKIMLAIMTTLTRRLRDVQAAVAPGPGPLPPGPLNHLTKAPGGAGGIFPLSGGLIASRVAAPVRMSSSDPKRMATTALPAARSARTVMRVAGTPGGAPSAELISATRASRAEASASNVTTREYSGMAAPSSRFARA